MKVSVCMATRNGELFLREQIDSILGQLDRHDELVISDDGSSDETLAIIRSYDDRRIRLIVNKHSSGIIKNFECSLTAANGDVIFLSDQDDVWSPNKIATMKRHLQSVDMVISDCLITDARLNSTGRSFYSVNRSGKGLLKNLLKNSYMGCCMAFNRSVLEKALPFPPNIPLHDAWIGIVADRYFSTRFIPDILVLHRRHNGNASTTSGKSRFSLRTRVSHRYTIIKGLFSRIRL